MACQHEPVDGRHRRPTRTAGDAGTFSLLTVPATILVVALPLLAYGIASLPFGQIMSASRHAVHANEASGSTSSHITSQSEDVEAGLDRTFGRP